MVKNNRKAYEMLISDMSLQKNEKILEIGYGPGTGIRTIAESCPDCTIHGIDFSELMYKMACKYNRNLIEQGRVQLQYGDFLEVPLTQAGFDKIFCLNVIYFWNKLKDPFDKVFSLLN
jgi:ubiquinone/menaquinone biosynthesis C-methylase UbiE